MTNQRIVGTEEIVYPTTVTLVADPHNIIKMFFCFNCQAPTLQYKGTIMTMVPGIGIVEPYTLQKCKNSRCPMVYSFMPIVQMSEKYLLQ
jgi:hypothetical protein